MPRASRSLSKEMKSVAYSCIFEILLSRQIQSRCVTASRMQFCDSIMLSIRESSFIKISVNEYLFSIMRPLIKIDYSIPYKFSEFEKKTLDIFRYKMKKKDYQEFLNKLSRMPEDAQTKLRETLQKIINCGVQTHSAEHCNIVFYFFRLGSKNLIHSLSCKHIRNKIAENNSTSKQKDLFK